MADEIKIDKGVPVPGRRHEILRRYPWRSMAIGDSFFVPNCPDTVRKGFSAAASAANIKIMSRTVRENDVSGIRVWRIA